MHAWSPWGRPYSSTVGGAVAPVRLLFKVDGRGRLKTQTGGQCANER